MSQEFQLTQELMEKLDKIHPNPEQLANTFYHEHINGKTLSAHEINSFCINWLATQAQGEYSFLTEPIKEAGRLFYFSHYYSLWEKHINGKLILLETEDSREVSDVQVSKESTDIKSES